MGLPLPSSREVLHRNPFPAGEPRHVAAGDEALEALLAGTDAEGFAGDRALLQRARAWLAERAGGSAPTVGEAYRLRSADRVEALFLHAAGNPRAIAGLPGRYEVGLVHAVEVTRADDLAFRTSPCWRRAGGRGWLLLDPGEAPTVRRQAGREAFAAAQDEALARGLALEAEGLEAAGRLGGRAVDVALALKATSLPHSVRDRAAVQLPPTATLADVVVSLAAVAAACDREEGEAYARAAGRLVLRADATVASAAAGDGTPA